jgi:hypothetical protein
MLAIVLDAFGGLDIVPQITASDRCGTPLYLCRWYADRYGCRIDTQKSDILSFQSDEPFDIICTDGLISNFYAEARADLVGVWHGLLRPGGLIVTANNIHAGSMGARPELPPDTVAALCEKAVERKATLPFKVDLPDDELRRLAHDFYALPRAPSVGSKNELEALFRPEKFRIEQWTYSEIAGHSARDSDETGNIRKALNARIVAAKL